MNILEELISVSLTPKNVLCESCVDGASKSLYSVDSCILLEPRQTLSLELEIAFDDEKCDKTPLVYCFLNTVGGTEWVETWKTLFDQVVVTPFLLPCPEATDSASMMNATEVSSGPVSPLKTPASSGGVVPTLLLPTDDRGNPSASASPRSGRFLFGKSPLGAPRVSGGGHGYEGRYRTSNAFDLTSGAKAASSIVLSNGVLVMEDGTDERHATPKSMKTTFTMDFVVPEWVSDPPLGSEGFTACNLAFLLVLPLSSSSSGTANRKETIMRQILLREYIPNGPSDMPPWLHHPSLQLGVAYLCARIQPTLQCQSYISPLRSDQLLLSLDIANRSPYPVWLQGASFDLHSTECVASANTEGEEGANDGGDAHWIAFKEGPRGVDLSRVNLLNKIMTVTPMLVRHDRPPFTLSPGETYSFQFVLQVLPQYCYLINPKSLEYIYVKQVVSEDAAAAPYDGRRQPAPQAPLYNFHGDVVSGDEIISVLSTRYVTHVEVFYQFKDGALESRDVLSLYHAAHWSFGASALA